MKIYLAEFLEDVKGVDGEDIDAYEFLLGSGFYRNGILVEVIEQVGGEGEGEHAHTIFKIGEEYWKCDYSYYSYHGFEFDDAMMVKVEPKEKTIIVYE